MWGCQAHNPNGHQSQQMLNWTRARCKTRNPQATTQPMKHLTPQCGKKHKLIATKNAHRTMTNPNIQKISPNTRYNQPMYNAHVNCEKLVPRKNSQTQTNRPNNTTQLPWQSRGEKIDTAKRNSHQNHDQHKCARTPDVPTTRNPTCKTPMTPTNEQISQDTHRKTRQQHTTGPTHSQSPRWHANKQCNPDKHRQSQTHLSCKSRAETPTTNTVPRKHRWTPNTPTQTRKQVSKHQMTRKGGKESSPRGPYRDPLGEDSFSP